jgi:transposase
MEYYAALDVSMESTCLCGVDEKGRIVRESKVATDPEAIGEWLVGVGVRWTLVGLEAGPLSNWLHARLTDQGFPAVLIETRNARAALKAMRNKTDRKDGRGLAHLLRTAMFREVKAKDLASQELRTLLGARHAIKQQLQNIENSIRGLVKNYGVRLGKGVRGRLKDKLATALSDLPRVAAIVEPLAELHQQLRQKLAGFDRELRRVAKSDPVVRLLMTAPGIGPVNGVAYRSTIDDPRRFRRSRTVGAHVGLTPKRYQSGETDYSGKISRAGDAMLRGLLYEAATTVLSRTHRWSRLKAWGVRLAARVGKKRARVAVARKLSVILHRMWLDQRPFEFGEVKRTAAA